MERGGPPRVTASRGWHPNRKKLSEFTNNTGKHDVGRYGKMGVGPDNTKKEVIFVAMTKKGHFLDGKNRGNTRQLPPRLTPTLVTPPTSC